MPFKYGKKAFYFPDVLLIDKKSKEIKYIIEVETDPVRKALVGSAITADYCLSIDKQKRKPKMFFIIGEKGLNQLHNFKFRENIINKYTKNIKNSIIGKKEDIFKKIK